MSISNQRFKKNKLAIALIIAVSAPTAQALEIKADVSGSVGASSPVAFSDIDGPAASGSVDVLGSVVGSSTLSNVFYHTYGNDSGNFGSRVSGNGTYDITGTFSYKDTITNTSGVTQAYNFDFTVIPGEIAISGLVPAVSGDFLMAEYTIDILVGGLSIWDSAAKIENNAGLFAFNDSGTHSLGGTLSSTTSFSAYAWDTYVGSTSLGVLADGASLDFEYILTSHAAGNLDCLSVTYEDGFDGVHPGGNAAGGIDRFGEMAGTCGSIARSGDPFNFNGDPISNSSGVTATTVPEPSSLALFGLGLTGFVAARRRKTKVTQ